MNATLSDIGLAAGKGPDADDQMTERCNWLRKLARNDFVLLTISFNSHRRSLC
jgi:hypothetical protein